MKSVHEGTGAASVATAAAVAVVTYSVWWRWSESKRVRTFLRGSSSSVGNSGRLPSPMPALPRWCGFVGGHTLTMEPTKLVTQLEGWADEFGGDYEIQLVGTRVICVTGLSDIRRILTLRPSKFKRGLGPDQLNWAAEQVAVKDSMFFEEGKAWGRSRRLISPNLNGHNVAAMLSVVSKIGERFCAKLGDKADKGEIVKARNSFERFTHDIIALAAFGVDADSVTATAERPSRSFDAMDFCLTTFAKLVVAPSAIWTWKLLPMVPWVRRTKEHVRRGQTVIQGAIDAARRHASAPVSTADGGAETADGTLLRKIIRATNGKGSSDRMLFTDQEVMHQAASLFVAATETSALSLTWAMYFLTKHPGDFSRCRAEALEAAPSSGGMASTSEQLSKLEFCSAVLKEALRLRTPAALTSFYGTEDFTMESGFVLKKGTGVVVLNRMIGRSDEFFTRAKDFVPERWISAEREEALLGGSKGTVTHEPEAFLAFGHGARICPGQDMAKAEGAIIIAAICARFDISMASGQPDPPEEVTAFTSGPEELGMIFTRRRQQVQTSSADR